MFIEAGVRAAELANLLVVPNHAIAIETAFHIVGADPSDVLCAGEAGRPFSGFRRRVVRGLVIFQSFASRPPTFGGLLV